MMFQNGWPYVRYVLISTTCCGPRDCVYDLRLSLHQITTLHALQLSYSRTSLFSNNCTVQLNMSIALSATPQSWPSSSPSGTFETSRMSPAKPSSCHSCVELHDAFWSISRVLQLSVPTPLCYTAVLSLKSLPHKYSHLRSFVPSSPLCSPCQSLRTYVPFSPLPYIVEFSQLYTCMPLSHLPSSPLLSIVRSSCKLESFLTLCLPAHCPTL